MDAQKIYDTLKKYTGNGEGIELSKASLWTFFNIYKSYCMNFVFEIYENDNPDKKNIISTLKTILWQIYTKDTQLHLHVYTESIFKINIIDLADPKLKFGKKSLEILIEVFSDLERNPEKYKDAELITREQAKIEYQK